MKYIRQLDSCGVSYNSDRSETNDSNDSIDSKQEQTCLQDFGTVCISKRRYLGFGGP